MSPNAILDRLKSPEIRPIFTRNHIRRIYLTGSFARGDATSTSDIDIIYEKEVGMPFTLFNIGDLKSSLEEAF
jgi:predicted nucleotidyltransferase